MPKCLHCPPCVRLHGVALGLIQRCSATPSVNLVWSTLTKTAIWAGVGVLGFPPDPFSFFLFFFFFLSHLESCFLLSAGQLCLQSGQILPIPLPLLLHLHPISPCPLPTQSCWDHPMTAFQYLSPLAVSSARTVHLGCVCLSPPCVLHPNFLQNILHWLQTVGFYWVLRIRLLGRWVGFVV